jgi:arylsulfatase A-like enzyme
MKLFNKLALPALLLASVAALPAADNQPARPNIIVILADDMGFSDLGCFGGEIQTPNLDQLAASGMRFTEFYNTSRCCPSRAAILTGLYPHQAGVGHMMENGGLPAYEGYLNEHCVTLAEVLKSAGYATAIAGKWHVGGNDFHVTPWLRGFDHGLCSVAGGFYYPDEPRPEKKSQGGNLWLDGKNLDDHSPELPKNWYTTDLYTDYGIKYIDQALAEQKPFFLYLAYNAPHFPLQAPAADIAKYRGKYLAGWDKLREQRHRWQLEHGIVDSAWPLSPLPKAVPNSLIKEVVPWDSLNAADQDRFDQIMAIYAACVDHLDQGIGRLVAHLKAKGTLDNTLIIFLSDNGGNVEGGPKGRLEGAVPGGPNSTVFCGESWATLENTPFRYYKHFEHEGGISSPFIVHWPQGMTNVGSLCKERAHIIDIMATCVDVSGAKYPTVYHGKTILPMEGKSLVPAFSGGKIGHDQICWEHEGNAAILEGDWKLVRLKNHPWELYNLPNDRTELHDLAAQEPAVAQDLETKWNIWARRTGALPKPTAAQRQNARQNPQPAGGKEPPDL